MEVSKHRSRKKERKKEKGSTCGQTTKGIAREEASTSHMRKGAGVL